MAEFPGLFLNEPSERHALRALPGAIAASLRWLRRHGEPVRSAAAPAVTVASRYVVKPRLRWGGYAVLHQFERPPVTRDEVARALRWMGFMRRDTLALVASLPADGLAWTRPGQERTIKRHLQHVAGAERWYLQRLALGPFPHLGRTSDPIERLARVRKMAVARLRRLTAAERARIHKIDHKWWSARKMLGRFLYHERYHLRSMARIAAHHGVRVPHGLGGWARY
ncbi:MAG: DinB family protein [Armatimonadetes bacterium]|nr:DinB family protein [Armatimonadota bacterium]